MKRKRQSPQCSATLRRFVSYIVVAAVCATAFASCGSSSFDVPVQKSKGHLPVVPVTGAVTPVHDPTIAFDHGTFHLYVTGTWIDQFTSTDLVHWRHAGSVFPHLPKWVAPTIGWAPTNLWAPDISYWGGRWHLYYTASEWQPDKLPTRNSAIALATNTTLNTHDPNYKWVDHGPVLHSQGKFSLDRSGFNAIDPNVVLDEHKKPWLAWGSSYEGLFIQPLRANGTLDTTTKPVNIAHRDGLVNVIEAPTIVRHGKWWYLFASYDFCCQGVRSTYNVRVGRSLSLTGPYLDRRGRKMTEGGGTKILTSHGKVRGPGGQDVFEHKGKWFLVHHWYDATNKGTPTLGIRPLGWSDDGWPNLSS